MLGEATCQGCGASFLKNSAPHLYCTARCRGVFRRNLPGHKEIANARLRKWKAENEAHHREYTFAYTQRRINAQPWLSLLTSTKNRAARKGIAHDLTPAWAEARWTGKCEVTDIEFSTNRIGRRMRMFRPSIDRIDSQIGYLQSNCRFTLWAVNVLKSDGDDATMYIIADAIAKNAAKYFIE